MKGIIIKENGDIEISYYNTLRELFNDNVSLLDEYRILDGFYQVFGNRYNNYEKYAVKTDLQKRYIDIDEIHFIDYYFNYVINDLHVTLHDDEGYDSNNQDVNDFWEYIGEHNN
jgi:hypothetical protein